MPDRQSLNADRLHQEMSSWHSIEINVHQDKTPQNVPARFRDPFVKVDEHYIETAVGERLFDQAITSRSGKVKRHVNYSDGERCANLFY